MLTALRPGIVGQRDTRELGRLQQPDRRLVSQVVPCAILVRRRVTDDRDVAEPRVG